MTREKLTGNGKDMRLLLTTKHLPACETHYIRSGSLFKLYTSLRMEVTLTKQLSEWHGSVHRLVSV